jgi:hypothetical protein
MDQTAIATSRPIAVKSSGEFLISFIVCGRNDNYMGNYTWRITTALNFLVRNLFRLGRQNDAEIILADWNSDVPFHKQMRLVPEARQIMRFLVVPPAIAVPAQRDSSFPNPIAQNAAIRRSRGRFVAVSDADVMLPASSLAVLFDILEGKVSIGSALDHTNLVASRRQVPTVRTKHNPPLAEIEGFIARNLAMLKRDPLMGGFGAPAGLVLLHRDRWEETRGYDERLIHHGWGDIDLHLRLSQIYPWVDLANYGVETVHLEHYSGPRGRGGGSAPRKYNGYPVSQRMMTNDQNWGLGNVNLSMQAPEAVMDEAAVAMTTAEAARSRCPATDAQTIARELQNTDSSDAVRLIERVLQVYPHPPNEIAVVGMLAWYARHRHPRTYIELGVQESTAPAIVIAGCPTCEVYGVDQWSEDDTGGNPPPYRASQILSAAGPQAQAHLITGDPMTALTRLFGQIAPDLLVDLALIRTDPKFGDAVGNARLLAGRLTPGGAVVVSARTPLEFAPVWNGLAHRVPRSVHLLHKNSAGQVQIGLLVSVS